MRNTVSEPSWSTQVQVQIYEPPLAAGAETGRRAIRVSPIHCGTTIPSDPSIYTALADAAALASPLPRAWQAVKCSLLCPSPKWWRFLRARTTATLVTSPPFPVGALSLRPESAPLEQLACAAEA